MTSIAALSDALTQPSAVWWRWPIADDRQEDGLYHCVKRAVDVVIALALIVLLAPLMAMVAAAIKLTSRGPVIFTQPRAGFDDAVFTMYKFRSMYHGAHKDRAGLAHMNQKDGPVFKIINDPRLTLIGRFLRRSSIDELPQLFNVLLGDMSLVGPRPLWLPEAKLAEGVARYRTVVKPGLTCLWQISGRSELSYDQWVKLDMYYICNRSPLLDMSIIAHTIPAVISGRGAY